MRKKSPELWLDVIVTPSFALSDVVGGVHATVAVDELVSEFLFISDGVP